MIKNKLYTEIFEEFSKEETKEGRIKVLQKYDCLRFREFLYGVFNKTVKFDVEIPQYQESKLPAGMNDTYIDTEFKKMYLFIVGNTKRPPELTKDKQSKLLKSILEALDKNESALLIKMFKKDLEIPYLTNKLVRAAFPTLDI